VKKVKINPRPVLLITTHTPGERRRMNGLGCSLHSELMAVTSVQTILRFRHTTSSVFELSGISRFSSS
jgi:hypothetical protein